MTSVSVHKKTVKSGGKKYTYWVMSWYDQGGRRRYENVGRVDEVGSREAHKAAKLKELEFAKKPSTSNITKNWKLSDFLDVYKNQRGVDLEPGTMDLHEMTGRYLVELYGAKRSLRSITAIDAGEFVPALLGGRLQKASRREKPRAIAPMTADGHLRNAKAMFTWGVDMGLLAENPFDAVKGMEPEAADWVYVDAAMFARLLNAVDHKPAWRMLFMLCRWAGLRRDEALFLPWHCIDWDGRTIRVKENDDFKPKTKRLEPVPIKTELYEALLAAFSAVEPGSVYVVPKGSINTRNLSRDFDVLCRRADFPRYGKPTHTLRKSCITDWARVHPIHTVMAWADHQNIETTAKYYLKVQQLDRDIATGRAANLAANRVQLGDGRPSTENDVAQVHDTE